MKHVYICYILFISDKKHELVNPENNTLTEALEVANTLNKDGMYILFVFVHVSKTRDMHLI